MRFLCFKILATITILFVFEDTFAQTQIPLNDRSFVQLPSLAELNYQRDINFTRGLDFDAINKKRGLEFVAGEIPAVGYGLFVLEMFVGAELAKKFDWNLWFYIPVATVIGMATMLGFIYVGDYIALKSNGVAAGSFSPIFFIHKKPYNDGTLFSILHDQIDSTISENGVASHTILNKMLDLYKVKYSENSTQYAECLTWCSLVCCMSGDVVQAKEKLNVSDRIFQENGSGSFEGRDTINEILRLDTEARIHYMDGVERRAIMCEEKSLNLKRQYFGENSKPYLLALLDLSRLYWERLRYKKSIKSHNDAFDAYIELIKDEFCKRGEYDRSMYWDDAQRYIGKTIDLAHDALGKPKLMTDGSLPSACYDALLVSKGILLNTNIEFIKYAETYGNANVQDLLFKRRELSSYGTEWRQIDSIDCEIIRNLDNDGLTFNIPSLSIGWKDVAAKLKEEDLAVEFYKTSNNQYGAVLIKKEWKSPKQIRLGNAVKINGKYESLDNAMSSASLDDIRSLNKNHLWNISKSIWTDEMVKYFPSDTVGTIYFSTDGSLQTYPIEYLPFVKPTDTTYYSVSDLYNMHRLSSTRELAIHDTVQGKNGTAIFGGLWYNYKDINRNYLKGTQIEVDHIVQIINRTNNTELKAMVYSRDKGTEDDFKKLSGGKNRIIHIGTHGFFDTIDGSSDNPMMLNGLLMSGYETALSLGKFDDHCTNKNDGRLTALEVSSLDLSGLELAVLSACETGMGKILGDGVYGLQRAFKMANTQGILMSLWKVDDRATQMLMTQFYENWLIKKMTKQKALKAAQEYVRNFEVDETEWERMGNDRGVVGGPYRPATSGKKKKPQESPSVPQHIVKPMADPYYWAGFILLDGLD